MTTQQNVTPGSYGRGVYAGHSTFGLDWKTPGSYGRGVYAGHSTFGLDWAPRDDYARGMRAAAQVAPAERMPTRERPASAD
jgi:hypothetical protein